MQVTLERVFPLKVPASTAWRLLQDLPFITACMPGARLLGRLDADRHLMLMTARIGPARVGFRGEVTMVARDAAGMRIDMDAHGADRRGTAASMRLTARIHPRESGHCELIGRAVFHVHGTLAVLGASLLRRAGDEIVRQFGDRFAARALMAETGTPPAASSENELDALLLVRRVLSGTRTDSVNRTS